MIGADWVDADAWLRYVSQDGQYETAGLNYDPTRPLNYTDAAKLAALGLFEYEHQSDGTTHIRIGPIYEYLRQPDGAFIRVGPVTIGREQAP